ncbi:transcription initiation protein SPT3 homolog isoform X1 [Patella vulgata]|uniref:transcription initiation protein SPT3 homolog isoform X1 n=1 Tax=Patella vulgata TaxID=6465 RepID=UPI00217F8FE5|nr:transcription initiation protein SPT3 homolog isoform X1 [Patella vulgata]
MSLPGIVKVSSLNNWFTTEVQHMMHGFGDCKKPLHDSAFLVQDLVHKQMANLLQQAAEVASTRTSRFIGIEDIVFLMRKDKIKLRRLLRYMKVKDTKALALRSAGLEEEENQEASEKPPPAGSVPMYKRRKVCYDFLSSIDQTGELIALFDDEGFDEIKHERMVRAELQSRNLDTKQYAEFCEARQSGFSRKYKFQRFKEWLMAGVNVDIKPNPHALEVISYLAYETVAEIVDLALIVKQDMRATVSDPMQKTLPQLCHNYHDAENLVKSAVGGLGSPSGQQSPPSTPSTPSIQASTAAPPLLTNQTSVSSNKSKSKKRRKSGQTSNIESQGDKVIHPSDIQEALRRYGQSIGPFASTTKVNTMVSPKQNLLCL